VDRARLAKLHPLAQVVVSSVIECGKARTVGEAMRQLEASESPRLRSLFRR
jgi:hypothetical protein